MSITISLDGQVAVLSGGARGIGAAAVRLLAQAGARVMFSYAANRDAAESLVADCARAGAQVAALECDAGSPGAGARLVEAAVARFQRVDIAVANAGIWNTDDIAIEDLDEATWQQTLDVNLRGVYSLARAAVVQMKRQPPLPPPAAAPAPAAPATPSSAASPTPSSAPSPRASSAPRGRIICVASTAGQRGEAWHTHYGASKAGVIGFVRGLAPEVAAAGIRVNCVAPGWVATDMAAAAIAAHPERVAAAIPLGRPGHVDEIAGCILFLCTGWSDFMTGSVLSANGGAVLA